MKKLLYVFAFLFTVSVPSCTPVWAAEFLYSAPSAAFTARLRDAPCTDPQVLRHIPIEVRAEFKSADAVLAGVPYEACWALVGPNHPVLVYSDGDFSELSPAFGTLERLPEI